LRRGSEFSALGLRAVRLGLVDAPILQRLLERCGDYYTMVEGRFAPPGAALAELTEGPAERVPHDLLCFGIFTEADALIGTIGALRHHRRQNQWYLGLMLLDPDFRGRGLGRAAYRAFERWILSQEADSILLAVVEPNVRAARFWRSMGFGQLKIYPEREIGLRRHVLIELEKTLTPRRREG